MSVCHVLVDTLKTKFGTAFSNMSEAKLRHPFPPKRRRRTPVNNLDADAAFDAIVQDIKRTNVECKKQNRIASIFQIPPPPPPPRKRPKLPPMQEDEAIDTCPVGVIRVETKVLTHLAGYAVLESLQSTRTDGQFLAPQDWPDYFTAFVTNNEDGTGYIMLDEKLGCTMIKTGDAVYGLALCVILSHGLAS